MFWCIATVIFATLDFFSDSLEGWDWEEWENDDEFDDFFYHDHFRNIPFYRTALFYSDSFDDTCGSTNDSISDRFCGFDDY